MRKELEALKDDLRVDPAKGFTKKERAYYKTRPVEFALKELKFKGRPVRLSEDQKIFLLSLQKWDPDVGTQYNWDTWEAPEQEFQRTIVVASRNGGKTFILAIYALWRALFFQHLWIREIGGSLTQAKIFYHQYFKKFIEANIKILAEVRGKVQTEKTEFRSGSVVETGTCSETSVRGPHPDILLLDEVAAADKAKKTDVIEAALDSALGQVVMVSTAHYASGLFIRYLLKAEQFGYKVFYWPACDLDIVTGEIIRVRAPWIPKSRIEHARMTKSENDFMVEWMASVKSTSQMVFKLENVEESIVQIEPTVILTELEKQDDDLVPDDLEHIPSHMRKYYEEEGLLEAGVDINTSVYGGCDIGYVHPTAIVIIKRDVNDVFWVIHNEFYRGRSARWRADRVTELQEKYGIEFFCLDAEDISFRHLCMEAGAIVRAVPFQNYKSQLIGALNNLFEKRAPDGKPLIRIPSKFDQLIDELRTYTYDDSGRPMKGFDDNLDALLFSLYFWSLSTGGMGFDIITEFNPWG